MTGLRIGSLCSGYGGLCALGLAPVIGGELMWHAEIDPGASRILAHHLRVPNHGDLTAVDWSAVEPVDWLTAGYPCQPFSFAGQRKGADDVRHLWPAVATAVWGVVRASDAGAAHRRERLFVVAADADGTRLEGLRQLHSAPREDQAAAHDRSPAPSADAPRINGRPLLLVEPEGATGTGDRVDWAVYSSAVEQWGRILGRPSPDPVESGRNGPRLSPRFVEWLMGLPAGWVTDVPGLSHKAQLKALGNGVVPQQAALALRLLTARQAVAA